MFLHHGWCCRQNGQWLAFRMASHGDIAVLAVAGLACVCWPRRTRLIYTQAILHYIFMRIKSREREMTWGKNTVQSTLRMGKYKACFVLRSQWRCSWRWSHSPTDCAAQTENNEWMDTRKKWYVRSSGRPKWRAKHEKRQNNLHYLLTKRRQ